MQAATTLVGWTAARRTWQASRMVSHSTLTPFPCQTNITNGNAIEENYQVEKVHSGSICLLLSSRIGSLGQTSTNAACILTTHCLAKPRKPSLSFLSELVNIVC